MRGRQFLNRFSRVDIGHARQMFKQAIDKDPNYETAWAGYADPDSAEAHASAGLAHFVREEFEDAEQEFKRAIDLKPALFEPYYYFARTRFHQGDMNAAAEWFAKAAAVNPDDYQSRLLRVQILVGQAERADRCLRRALEIDPNDSIILYNVACHYATLGKVEKSLDYLERAIEFGTASPGWMRNDKDLESQHGHPRCEALLGKVSD